MESETASHSLRAVIAINDRFTQAFLQRQLGRVQTPIEVTCTSDGVETLELLESQTNDLLFLDVDLAGLGGLELLEILRADDRFQGLQIIVISGVGLEGTVKRAIELGVNDYILRPYQSEAVEARVLAALERVREHRASAKHTRNLPLILLGDADPNFAETLKSSLAGICDVAIRADGGKLLSSALRENPDGVLIGSTSGGLNAERLVRVLSSARPDVKVGLLREPSDDPPDGLHVTRTFVPELLLSACQTVFGIEGKSESASPEWLRAIEPSIATAVNQTFGVMTGHDIAVSSEQGSPAGLSSSIELHFEDRPEPVGVVVVADAALCREIVARMLMIEESEVSDSDIGGVLDEVVNVVAGRIKQDSVDRGWPLKQGLPSHKTLSAEDAESRAFDLTLRFEWNAADYLWLLVSLPPGVR